MSEPSYSEALALINARVDDILQRALAGYTPDYKTPDGYIQWGKVQDDIRALFGQNEGTAAILRELGELRHLAQSARLALRYPNTSVARRTLAALDAFLGPDTDNPPAADELRGAV